ncbi:MAG TPA: NAD(P)-dependent oxidoreductase [Gemmataceae bacterium]|nr:NAD(P)-dependent oxidoreductase [Gemmataceae bacterium]
MRTALVFAGSSYIGRWLVRRLRERGWRVTATTRSGAMPCDLRDAAAVEAAVQAVRPDWVFSCAGATRDEGWREAFDLHLGGSLNVLDAVRRHAAGAGVTLLGSAAEYAPADFPLREDHPIAPRSFFGASKAAQTQAAAAAAAEWGMRIITARPFNVIGPGLPEHYVAAALAARLRRQSAEAPRDFAVVNAQATRDFIDVRDTAEALAALAESPPAAGEHAVFNIATGVETPLLEMAAELGRLAGGFTPVPAGGAASRGGAVRSCGEASRLRRAVGWAPRWSWRESLADLWRSPNEVAAAA